MAMKLSIPGNIAAMLRQSRGTAALDACERWLLDAGAAPGALLDAAQLAKTMGRFDHMRDWARRGVDKAPRNMSARLLWIESKIYCGDVGDAIADLACLESEADGAGDDVLLQNVAAQYSNCAQHHAALRCHEKSWRLQPGNPTYAYNLATSAVTVGDMDRAEGLFDEVLRIQPGDHGALLNRSQLRTWSGDDNHIDELMSALSSRSENAPGRSHVLYALGKEFEDIGDYQEAFSYFASGANHRRRQLAYRVEADEAAIDQIASTFSADFLARVDIRTAQAAPIFVLGLPRSGTTLVEHVLAAHSRVGTCGESEALAFALMRLAAGDGGKSAMIARSVKVNFESLGEIYRHSLAGYGQREPFLINKTPLNFLYLGLIRLALPESRIIHLKRSPMDVCFAMFKTHFRMGYPFSYSFDDLARYYGAYDRLMAHWRKCMPDGFLDVAYEDVVDDLDGSARTMVSHCGLEWEERCLQFHAQATPSATASASQVRRPIYRTSVARWRSYSEQLAPLAERLQANGIHAE